MTAPCLPEQKTQLENKDRQIANLKAKMGGGGMSSTFNINR